MGTMPEWQIKDASEAARMVAGKNSHFCSGSSFSQDQFCKLKGLHWASLTSCSSTQPNDYKADNQARQQHILIRMQCSPIVANHFPSLVLGLLALSAQ